MFWIHSTNKDSLPDMNIIFQNQESGLEAIVN
jgi:hypothetical protein